MKLTLTKHSVILNTLIPISLFVITQLAIFGQFIPTKTDQIHLEVAEQSGSPVQITAIGVRDNPNFEDVQIVEFTIQNISQKKIIAFCPALWTASYTDKCSTIYHQFDFVPGKVIQTSLQLNKNLRSSDKLTLSIDYILFSNLSGWGPDSQKQSEFEAGYYAGEKHAIDQTKQFIKDRNKVDLFVLLRLAQTGEIDEYPLIMTKGRSQKWGEGFKSGYGVALIQLLPPIDAKTGKYPPIEDKLALEDFAGRLKKVEYNRAVYLDNPN